LAFEQMLGRDGERFADLDARLALAPLGAGALAGSALHLARGATRAAARLTRAPLGACALAGSTLPLYRAAAAAALGFEGPNPNSMDAVASRDGALEFLPAGAICMVHLSRLAEELVLWSSAEFGFVELADAYSTGSSLTPPKKKHHLAGLVGRN